MQVAWKNKPTGAIMAWTPQDETYSQHYYQDEEPVDRQIIDLKGLTNITYYLLLTIFILLNGHKIKLILNDWLQTHRIIHLSP